MSTVLVIDYAAIAIAWFDHGFMPLPLSPDGSKSPAVGSWRQWQDARPRRGEVVNIFARMPHEGLGLITGASSGGLEMLELEGRAITEGYLNELSAKLEAMGQGRLWAKITGGYVELTPSGGVHYYFRTIEGTPRPNTKLARRPATEAELEANPGDRIKVMIETRGQGGFTVIAPSAGRSHPTGKAWKIINGEPGIVPTITGAERDLIYAVCTELDTMPVAELGPARASVGNGQDQSRPGDDFSLRADWPSILKPHGWQLIMRGQGVTYWQRPGKRHRGVSASTGRNDQDRLFVFSTATEFATETPYTKFAAYAVLNHGGDYSAAASELRRQGYGAAPEPALPGIVVKPAPAPAPAPARAPAPAGVELETDDQGFFDLHPLFGQLRLFAHSRGVSAWALLGCCLIRTLANVPPWVRLPAIIGAEASLNMCLALVGPSGVGKSSAMAVAEEAVLIERPRFLTVPLGTGEGIVRTYKRSRPGMKGQPAIIEDLTDSAIFTAPEVDTLTRLIERGGATLGPVIKMAYDGARLGFGNATEDRRIWLEPHGYRFCIELGVQPEKGAALFDDTAGGTPGRFAWLPAIDPAMPDRLPDQPEPIILADQEWHRTLGKLTLTVPDPIRELIKDMHIKRLKGVSVPIDGHTLLTQLKVAQGLAFLIGERVMRDEHWQWAGKVMQVSTMTRDGILSALELERVGKEGSRAKADARRAVVVAEAVEGRALSRVSKSLLRALEGNEGRMPWAKLRRSVASRDRALTPEALEALITAGLVKVEESEKGKTIVKT